MPIQFSPATFAPSLYLVKRHLRITDDGDSDTLLALYLSTAMEHIRHVTRQDWPTDLALCPPELFAAALLLVGDLYENREAQSPVPLSQNMTVERLLWPHRKFD